VQQLPAVEGIVPIVMGTAAIKHGNRTRHTDVAGIGAMAPRMWKLQVAQGVFLPDEELERARAFMVLGSKLHEELFGAASPLGEYVHAGSSRYRVIGVLAPKGQFMGTDLDDMAYIPVARAMDLFNRDSLIELDIMHSANMSSELVSARVSELLIRRHGMEDFTIITQDQALSTLDNILNILKYAAAGLGAVSLLVGGVGILTILMITVAERTQEVGLLRALGVTRGQIRLMFLGEAVLISLAGAIAGIAAIAILLLALSQLAPDLPLALSAPIIMLALITATVVGLISGVQPAVNATRMSPIDALRAE
jgi:putative ABC transport system permease protein